MASHDTYPRHFVLAGAVGAGILLALAVHMLGQRFGLLMTGSSDYHGAGKPNRLGENTTDLATVERIAELGALELVGG